MQRIDGLLKSVLPLPSGLSNSLARVVHEEVESIIKSEDLQTLTKKIVRMRAQQRLKAKMNMYTAGGSQLLPTLSADWQECVKNKTLFDFDVSEMKLWINLVINEVLADMSRM